MILFTELALCALWETLYIFNFNDPSILNFIGSRKKTRIGCKESLVFIGTKAA